eukprot:c25686_g1_i1 orf=422-577(+)
MSIFIENLETMVRRKLLPAADDASETDPQNELHDRIKRLILSQFSMSKRWT